MTLTRTQVLNEALRLIRGTQDQSDEEARLDIATAVDAQASWSAEDKVKVKTLVEQLLAAEDNLQDQQQVIENYNRTE